MLTEYMRLSDVMFQALKTGHYNIFENALKDRGDLVASSEQQGDLYDAFSSEEKEKWKKRIKDADNRIEDEMDNYKKHLEEELSKVYSSQAKLRKHSKVGAYYGAGQTNQAGQGRFINKLK